VNLIRTPLAECPVPSLDAPGVEVWRDANGAVAAVGYRRGPHHALHVPGVGTFFFQAASDAVMLVAESSASETLIDDAFHRIALPLALQLRGPQVLHASAVLIEDSVVALCGRAGDGKSTLAYALSRRGHTLWGDDAVAFEVCADRIDVRPLPFRMRLRPASAEWFDAPGLQKGAELSSTWRSGPAARPFRAVIVLERGDDTDGDDVDAVRLEPADALHALLPHAYYVALDDGDLNRRLVSTYLGLADVLPVISLRYTPRLALVERMAELVERTVAAL
jgi:hypothetical protein